MDRNKLLAMALGVDRAISVPAKILISKASGGTEAVKVEEQGLHYIIIGGSGYSTDEILSTKDGWQMMECELVVIPKRIYRKNKEPNFGNLRLDQAVCSNFADRDAWKECEVFNEEG